MKRFFCITICCILICTVAAAAFSSCVNVSGKENTPDPIIDVEAPNTNYIPESPSVGPSMPGTSGEPNVTATPQASGTVIPSQTPAPTPTPVPTPVPKPSVNPYPSDPNEAALADAGKKFMKNLRSQKEYADLDLKAKYGYPYLICINKKQNCVTVYCVDEEGNYTRPYLSMVCSGGSATPLGIFNTSNRYSWHTLMGPCYGQYCTRIVDGVLFHSVPYYTMHKYDLEYKSYNRLGKSVSHGCVRLATNDAKWIYDNCPRGTTVVIYNDNSSAGPLGRPKPIHIDTSNIYLRGWDPTDPDPANPWDDKYVSGTTIRSQLAQKDYEYAMSHGTWNGSINRPEAPTPTPHVTPKPTPDASPTIDPSMSPELTPDPSSEPTDPLSPTPEMTPSAGPTQGITPTPTQEITPAPTQVPTPTPTQAVTPTPIVTPTPGETQQPTDSPKTSPRPGRRTWHEYYAAYAAAHVKMAVE